MKLNSNKYKHLENIITMLSYFTFNNIYYNNNYIIMFYAKI